MAYRPINPREDGKSYCQERAAAVYDAKPSEGRRKKKPKPKPKVDPDPTPKNDPA